MHVLNIGSLNIDNVYQVPHFLRGGETVAAYRRTLHVGGKGLNQSVALARAGIASSHAGIIGRDGEVLKNFLEAEGVNVAHVEMRADEASGHTVIQISPEGENAILYYPGTNTCLTREFVKNAVSDLKEGDVLLLQNETNAIRDAIEIGLEKGLRIVFNPAPFDRSVPLLPLNQTAALILTEGEARGLSQIPPQLRECGVQQQPVLNNMILSHFRVLFFQRHRPLAAWLCAFQDSLPNFSRPTAWMRWSIPLRPEIPLRGTLSVR